MIHDRDLRVIASDPAAIHFSYQRYVVNHLRETFKLKVPIRMFWRAP